MSVNNITIPDPESVAECLSRLESSLDQAEMGYENENLDQMVVSVSQARHELRQTRDMLGLVTNNAANSDPEQ